MNIDFRLLESEVVPLTPELARNFRDMPASPTERPLDPARLKLLSEKIDLGLFIPPHWSKANYNGQIIRLNGQHSSHVLSECNGNFPHNIQAHIDLYEVTTRDGLAQLFAQFDARKSGRSLSDVSGAYQGLHEELGGIPREIAKLGIDSVAWFRRNIEGVPTPSGDQVYSLFKETGLHGFLKWLGELVTIKTPELKRTQVGSAMYATFTKNADEAKNFWDEVARGGDRFEESAPSTVLDTWLKTTKETGRNGTKMPLKPGNFYNGCIHAWNASRQSKSIKTINFETKKGWFEAAD